MPILKNQFDNQIKTNSWLCLSFIQCEEHWCHWACLRIKMRKLSVIRGSTSKWKQCLRGHLLPIQFSFIWGYKHVSVSPFLFLFFRKTKTKKSTALNIIGSRKTLVSMKIPRKKIPIYICGTRKLSDNCKKKQPYKQKQHASCWGFNAGSILLPDLISTNLKTSFYSGRTAQ